MAWRHVLVWGVHGSVSLALVLTLPQDFPAREMIPAMTFGVTAFSIVVQGRTVQPLMRKLRIKMGEEDEYDRVRVRRMALTAGREDLESLHEEQLISEPVFEKLRRGIEEEVAEVGREVKVPHERRPELADEEIRSAREHTTLAEKRAIQRALGEGWISLHGAEQLLAAADDELEKLGGGSG